MAEEFDLNHENLRKIFVGGLNRSTTDDELRQYFSQFGEIQDHVVIKDSQSGTSRGFGFVTYNEVESVENVLDESNQKQHEISGKGLDVKRAMPREFEPSAHTKVKKLFAGGLSKDVDEAGLQNYLDSRHSQGKCGHITNIEIKRDKETSVSKGFGFIEVSTTHLADRIAISERTFTLCDKKSTIKKAEPKGEESGRGGGAGRGRGGSSRGGSYGGQSNGYSGGGYGGQQGGYGGQQGGYGGGQQGGYGGGQQGGYGGGQQGGYGGGQQGGGYGMTSYPNQSQYGGGYGGGY